MLHSKLVSSPIKSINYKIAISSKILKKIYIKKWYKRLVYIHYLQNTRDRLLIIIIFTLTVSFKILFLNPFFLYN